jgi:translation initiation factor IF-3
VPVPRRFDRRPPERDTTRINERIRVPEVRVIGDDGQQIGIMKTEEALALAQERELDLVEVAPDARPPVTRILDYSKYKYEQAQKQKAARKHQTQITIREIKFRPKIAEHDYSTKKGHVTRFLLHKDKVKITIMFRGREVTHPERGKMILDRLAEELDALAVIEQRPNLDGRNMTMVLGPSKAVLSGEIDKSSPEVAAAAAAHATVNLDDPNAGPPAAEPQGAGAPAEAEAPADAAAPAEAADADAPAPAEAPADAEAPAGNGNGAEEQAPQAEQAPATKS